MIKQLRKTLKNQFPMSMRDWLISVAIMGAACLICLFLQQITTSDVHVPLVFVLVVLLIALTTDGYFYGTLASVVSVFAVNYAFTYPYFKLDFSLYGYPLTFVTMLTVGIATSTLTSRVKAQEKLRIESEKEKVRANLLRAISHDLRTPLTSISGSISAVLEDNGSFSRSERDELLQDARKDADWLCRMVENLLSITRISDNVVSAIRREDEVLEEIFGEAVINFKKKNPAVTVEVSVPEELVFVSVDAMLVEQVLINLMDNAVRHGETTTRIDLSAELAGKNAVISVGDNGRGIDDETLKGLFGAPVVKKQPADTTRSMGIGLLVCKTIVEAHGGKIYAENQDGGGAKITFTLQLGGMKNDH